MKKLVSVVLLLLLTTIAFSAAAQDSDACAPTQVADYAEFLSDNYDVSFTDTVDQDQFVSAAESIAGEVETPTEIDADGFTGLEAVLTSLYYANLDELALTYSEDKAADAIAVLADAPQDLAFEQQQELAAAIDTGLLETDCLSVDLAAPASADFANYLLGRTLVFTGQYENFLGYASDSDIYNRLIYTWNSFDQVLTPELQASANELIREGIITGYNLKRETLNANFDTDLTIIYGHANIEHAVQLIGLLRSEDLDARVLLEPKTSAFLYLAEWGEPGTSPEFHVEPLDDGNYIAYAKEYDLAFEFETAEDRDRFDAIIKEFAKKDEDGEPGLIISSWFQPLYSSRTEIEGYTAVRNNVVHVGQFYLQSFSLTENSDTIIERFEESYPDAEVEVYDLWVNEAFHNYLLGEPL